MEQLIDRKGNGLIKIVIGIRRCGKSYNGTPLKYYFMDMGLRNSRIHYRQVDVTHAMENVIYNELRTRGFHVDVGKLTVVEKGKDTKPVKKQLEVDFICSKGSKKYYIQSAYMLETEEKVEQEIRPLGKWRKKNGIPKVKSFEHYTEQNGRTVHELGSGPEPLYIRKKLCTKEQINFAIYIPVCAVIAWNCTLI